MKTLPHQKQTPAARNAQAGSTASTLDRLAEKSVELVPVISWMQSNGCDPTLAIKAAMAKLVERGNHLPGEQRLLYAKKVLLSEFFFRWALKHRGTTVQKLQDNEKTNESEVRPVEFALMAVGDARAFLKTLPRLAKVKTVTRSGGDLGNAHDFSCFVLNHAAVIAHRFLSNFDPTVKNAAAKAVKYIELTAVSHYLRNGVQVARDDSGITNHMRESRRLSDRTKLAAKLAYLPSILSDAERGVLRQKYGLKGTLVKRMRVKDVAKLLGFPNAAVLSRKLYRLKKWAAGPKRKFCTEVQY